MMDIERMLRGIPMITREEASVLVAAGVDSPHRIVSEQVGDLSYLGLPEERIEELAREICWLDLLRNRGQVELLRAARDVDLTPLFEAGIRTLLQLL